MSNQEVCREKRTNRDLGPPIRLCFASAMRRGCTECNRRSDSENSAVGIHGVKSHETGAMKWGRRQWRARFANRAVKAAQPRTARPEQAERLERVIREPQWSATCPSLS